MREIKFRAWDKEEKEMRQVIVMTGDAYEISVRDIHGERYWQDYRTFELMQYTGLKDKNGVEIYEGDIVKGYLVSPSDRPQIIKWNKHSTGFWRYDTNGIEYTHLWQAEDGEEFGEIIGNIWEHSHLLNNSEL